MMREEILKQFEKDWQEFSTLANRPLTDEDRQLALWFWTTAKIASSQTNHDRLMRLAALVRERGERLRATDVQG